MRSRLAAARSKLRALPRRRRAGVAIGAIAAAALAIGVVVAAGLPGSSPAANSPGKVAGATTVQRRDLVATDTESGTLSYARPQTVFNRLSGTITWLPTVGQVVKPGQTLYQVDGQPVVLFNGTTPAYRDLTSGVGDGADVLELNGDLVTMGFDPGHEITVNNSWQTGTTDAVERWQASIGASQTGTISLGQAVFLPGTQRITSVSTVLGSTGGSGAGSGASSGAGTSSGSGSGSNSGSGSTSGAGSSSGAATTVSPRAQFVSLTTNQVASPPAAAVGSGGRSSASAGDVRAAWDAACGANDMQQLAILKRRHPNVLASVQPSDCAPKPTPAADPPPSVAAEPTIAQAAATSTTTVEASQKAPTLTTTTPSNTNPSGSSSPSGNGSASGSSPSGKHGSGGKSSAGGDASLQSALAALLRAEALELRRDSASSSRGGASTSSAGGASSGGRLSSSPSTSGGGGASSGGGGSAGGGGGGSAGSSGGANAQPILGTTSNQLDVMVNLDATKQSEAVVGEPVTVQMPDGSVVDGKITQVSPVAQSSSSSSSGSSNGSGSSGGGSSSTPTSTVPVTVALHGHLPTSGLDQAAVSVNFEQQVERGVLSVPVTALLAQAGGGYAVQEAVSSHRLIPVTPGLFAAGYVQVSSSQIYPGLQVTDSQG